VILGITLARGGSKGLPRKNIAMCAGKPLIAWTIEHAKKSGLLGNYIVSTDDVEIAIVVQQCGATVLPRPDSLSTGEVNRWDVLKYYVNLLPDVTSVCLLQATSPIRSEGLIDDCIREFVNKGATSLATGFWHHDQQYPENRGKNRQEMQPRFFDDGNVYIWRRDLIEKHDKQDAGEKPILRVNNKLASIDINDREDLWMAERVLLESPFNRV
jgi:CMP-N,N'-diacetyllegionaminic acid synthase